MASQRALSLEHLPKKNLMPLQAEEDEGACKEMTVGGGEVHLGVKTNTQQLISCFIKSTQDSSAQRSLCSATKGVTAGRGQFIWLNTFDEPALVEISALRLRAQLLGCVWDKAYFSSSLPLVHWPDPQTTAGFAALRCKAMAERNLCSPGN